MAVDPSGLAIGVVGLLVAFKGAVDGFALIEAIIEKDNDSRYLALQHFQVEDPALCKFKDESKQTQKLIAATLAEISATQDAALPYVKRYNMQVPEVEKSVAKGMLNIGSAWVKKVKEKRASHAQGHRSRWALHDKPKFERLVGKLTKLNSYL